MLWMLTGTGAFGLLFLFEYQKCRHVKRKQDGKNPWFFLGTLLLILSCAALGRESTCAGGIRLAAGVLILLAGIVFILWFCRSRWMPENIPEILGNLLSAAADFMVGYAIRVYGAFWCAGSGMA